MPPCSLSAHQTCASCHMWLVMLGKPREQLQQALQGNPHRLHRELLVQTVVLVQQLPWPKGSTHPSLPVCLHNGSRKHARQLPAVHGKGIQQRNVICLHFNSLGKEKQQLTSSLGVRHSARHQRKTQEKIHVWVSQREKGFLHWTGHVLRSARQDGKHSKTWDKWLTAHTSQTVKGVCLKC